MCRLMPMMNSVGLVSTRAGSQITTHRWLKCRDAIAPFRSGCKGCEREQDRARGRGRGSRVLLRSLRGVPALGPDERRPAPRLQRGQAYDDGVFLEWRVLRVVIVSITDLTSRRQRRCTQLLS